MERTIRKRKIKTSDGSGFHLQLSFGNEGPVSVNDLEILIGEVFKDFNWLLLSEIVVEVARCSQTFGQVGVGFDVCLGTIIPEEYSEIDTSD